MLTPYPASLNYEALLVFGKAAALAAQGKWDEIDSALGVHASWDVAGYGLKVWKPDPLIIMSAMNSLTAEDYNKVVKACTDATLVAGVDTVAQSVLDSFPWTTALAIALQIIQWFLSKK